MSSEGMPTVRLDSGMIQWEYRVSHIPTNGELFINGFDVDEIAGYLNGVGLDGWELVSLTVAPNNDGIGGLIAVFKRPRR